MPKIITKFMVAALMTLLGLCIISCGKDEMREAIQIQDVQAVRRLLQKGAGINAPDEYGETPLMSAVVFSHMDSVIRGHNPTMVKFLLEQGADINARTYGQTPLMVAAFFGDVEIVKLLVGKGADPNIQGDNAITAVQTAADGGHPEVVKLLLAKGGKITLAAAACIGDLEQAQRLIKDGADVNANGFWGCKPLMAATRGGNLDVIKALLEKGADINSHNGAGETALMLALRSECQADVVKLLLEKGADVNARSQRGETALMMVVKEEDQPDVLKMILEKGADVNASSKEGKTALKIASAYVRLDSIKLLKAHGARE